MADARRSAGDADDERGARERPVQETRWIVLKFVGRREETV